MKTCSPNSLSHVSIDLLLSITYTKTLRKNVSNFGYFIRILNWTFKNIIAYISKFKSKLAHKKKFNIMILVYGDFLSENNFSGAMKNLSWTGISFFPIGSVFKVRLFETLILFTLDGRECLELKIPTSEFTKEYQNVNG